MIDQATGEWLLVWTIRLSMLCYLARLLTAIRFGQPNVLIARVPTRGECIFWTLGCVLYLVHVACAFAYAHDWSHAAALEHTAIETERIAGIRRGEGLWVNYVFTIVWIADASRLWIAQRHQRETHRKADWAVHGFFGFIVFNATVVFGPPLYRWGSILVAFVFAVMLWQRKSRMRKAPSGSAKP